jgi:hypothetical protein
MASPSSSTPTEATTLVKPTSNIRRVIVTKVEKETWNNWTNTLPFGCQIEDHDGVPNKEEKLYVQWKGTRKDKPKQYQSIVEGARLRLLVHDDTRIACEMVDVQSGVSGSAGGSAKPGNQMEASPAATTPVQKAPAVVKAGIDLSSASSSRPAAAAAAGVGSTTLAPSATDNSRRCILPGCTST